MTITITTPEDGTQTFNDAADIPEALNYAGGDLFGSAVVTDGDATSHYEADADGWCADGTVVARFLSDIVRGDLPIYDALRTKTNYNIPATVDGYPTWGDNTGTYGDDYEQDVKDAFGKIARSEGYDYDDWRDVMTADADVDVDQMDEDFHRMAAEAHDAVANG